MPAMCQSFPRHELRAISHKPLATSSLSRAALADVFAHNPLPLSLRLQNVLGGIARGAVSSAMFRNDVRFFPHLPARIGNCNRQSTLPHDGEVNHIVANESRLGCFDAFLFENAFETSELVLNALVDMIDS